jgi:hypothetical protein
MSKYNPKDLMVGVFGGDTRFPIVSRGLYELLGRFTTGPSVDSSVCSVAERAGILVQLPQINISHETISDTVTSRKYQASEIMNKRHGEVSGEAEKDIKIIERAMK